MISGGTKEEEEWIGKRMGRGAAGKTKYKTTFKNMEAKQWQNKAFQMRKNIPSEVCIWWRNLIKCWHTLKKKKTWEIY